MFLTIVVFVGNVDMSFAAGDSTHSHPICGNSCRCTSSSHSNQTWSAWDGKTALNSGYYYLTKDIVLSSTKILNTGYTTYLCLNGYIITCEDAVFDIYSTTSLLISDCVGTGKVESTNAMYTIGNSKYLSVWGGTIQNLNGPYTICAWLRWPVFSALATLPAGAFLSCFAKKGTKESTRGEATLFFFRFSLLFETFLPEK